MADEPQDERPDWLPDKFKSAEDMARSYTELESAHGRLRSEAETQREQFSAALAAIDEPDERQPQQGQWSPQADPTMIAMQNALEQGDAATFAAIQLQLNQAAIQQTIADALKPLQDQFASANTVDKDVALRLAEQQVAGQFGDEWAEIAPKVTERLRNPNVLPQVPTVEGYAAAISEQAKLVRYETLEARDRAFEAERQAKLQAQTLGGGVARTQTDTDAKKQEWQDVVNADVQSYSKLVGG